MKVQIQAAQTQDLEQLDEFMYVLHQEHHELCPELFKSAEDIEQEKSIARYLQSPDGLVYIAKDLNSGKLVGFITGHFGELVSTVSKAIPMGSIDELYVLPECRHLGIGKSLLEKIEQTLIDYGVQQLFVEVWDCNHSAKSLYNNLGYNTHIHWLRKPVI